MIKVHNAQTSRPLLAALTAILGCGFWCNCADGAAWTVIKHNDRDYVTAKNITNFYHFASLDIKNGTLKFRSPKVEMEIRSGSDNLYINRILFRLSYPVMYKDRKYLFSRIDLAKLIDPVLRPSYIKSAKRFRSVVIDPGHGGSDPGSKSIYGHEKDFNLKLANLLKRDLERRGFRVRMTRSGDTFPTLRERVEFTNRISEAIFISLHFNAFTNSTAKGIETYALSPMGSGTHNERGIKENTLTGNARDSENIALATAIHASLLKKTHAEDRGIKRDRFTVLAGINKPAVLVEGGFLSNPEEARKIASPSYLALLSTGIADAVVTYRNALRK
ncbi:MAG: N-acetylmuramoyl-L-alanine amidase [Verrucomicrobiales bacterium]